MREKVLPSYFILADKPSTSPFGDWKLVRVQTDGVFGRRQTVSHFRSQPLVS